MVRLALPNITGLTLSADPLTVSTGSAVQQSGRRLQPPEPIPPTVLYHYTSMEVLEKIRALNRFGQRHAATSPEKRYKSPVESNHGSDTARFAKPLVLGQGDLQPMRRPTGRLGFHEGSA